jgi:hypothetical protein
VRRRMEFVIHRFFNEKCGSFHVMSSIQLASSALAEMTSHAGLKPYATRTCHLAHKVNLFGSMYFTQALGVWPKKCAITIAQLQIVIHCGILSYSSKVFTL